MVRGNRRRRSLRDTNMIIYDDNIRIISAASGSLCRAVLLNIGGANMIACLLSSLSSIIDCLRKPHKPPGVRIHI